MWKWKIRSSQIVIPGMLISSKEWVGFQLRFCPSCNSDLSSCPFSLPFFLKFPCPIGCPPFSLAHSFFSCHAATRPTLHTSSSLQLQLALCSLFFLSHLAAQKQPSSRPIQPPNIAHSQDGKKKKEKRKKEKKKEFPPSEGVHTHLNHFSSISTLFQFCFVSCFVNFRLS